jgi:hypothetical protein
MIRPSNPDAIRERTVDLMRRTEHEYETNLDRRVDAANILENRISQYTKKDKTTKITDKNKKDFISSFKYDTEGLESLRNQYMPEIPPNKFYSNIAISFKLANDEAKNEAKQSTKQIARQKEANDNMIKLAKIDASKILAKHMTKSVNRILGTTAKAKGIKTRRKKGRKTRRI